MSESANPTTHAGWMRYDPDVVLEFDAPVAAVDRKGRGRLTRAQNLICGELFCYLPPIEPRDGGKGAA